MDEDYQQQNYGVKKVGKQHNTLPLWGNEASMNLNPLILANIQGSSYFKVHLFKLKTYHEVVDEIYYQVKHLEPWERGSRKTSGQTGMCGGVRGVGAGGIVSTAFCLLYKLYTLRLTRKQVNGLLNHTDSPYIRALGFMYIRYTQPPADLYDWYEDYLQDEEEIDVKAGGGQEITIGQVVFQFLTKLDWFSTLFPRIPVPIQKQIEKKLENYCRENQVNLHQLNAKVSGGAGIGGGGNCGGNNFVRYDDRNYSNAGGRGGRGGVGGGGVAGRDDYYNKQTSALPASASYRTEHDERGSTTDYYHSSSSSCHRRRDISDRSPPPSDERNSSGREKHKKKHKHRERSRSRSRSHSRNGRSERDRERDRHDRKESTNSSNHREKGDRDRDKDYDSDRRYR